MNKLHTDQARALEDAVLRIRYSLTLSRQRSQASTAYSYEPCAKSGAAAGGHACARQAQRGPRRQRHPPRRPRPTPPRLHSGAARADKRRSGRKGVGGPVVRVTKVEGDDDRVAGSVTGRCPTRARRRPAWVRPRRLGTRVRRRRRGSRPRQRGTAERGVVET